eukprot:m.56034 g.56034  ORF g.56034 m.56034 type:complete len:313 (+) comp11536_c0_seq1:179-1117(+)
MTTATIDRNRWQERITLHRGWHRMSASDVSRPLENTRQAFLQATQLGAAFAECDVWVTSDNYLVLCHNSTLASMAEDDTNPLASTPIIELTWDQVQTITLKDGSTPALLSTVLRDMIGARTKMAVELKCPHSGATLALLLEEEPELIASVGFVMSFAQDNVISFRGCVQHHAVLGNIPTLWLTRSPSPPDYVDTNVEGETCFELLDLNVTTFLQQQPFYETIMSVGFHGMYIQYMPGLTRAHILAMKQELSTLLQLPLAQVFVGVWSSARRNPEFDTPESLMYYTAAANGVNTDCPYLSQIASLPALLSQAD